MGRLKERKIIATLAAFVGSGVVIIEVAHHILVNHYHLPHQIVDICIVTLAGALIGTLIWRWFKGAEKRPGKVKVEVLVVPLILLLTLVIDLKFIFVMTGVSLNMLLIGIVALCLGIAWVIFKSLQWAASAPEAKKKAEVLKSKEEKPISIPEWKKSIAVLPFTNMSADPEQEYFCDGMAEEIINSLTHIKDLSVIARTSAFAFKNRNEDIREIGRRLDVAHLLEGSVRKSGNRLRITAQLINVSDGSHLWSERYERNMEDIFDIQDEISLAIVEKLKVKLLSGEKEAVVKRFTDNPQLYNLYLLGRYHWNKLTENDLKKSQNYFERAISLDPEYAPAYAGIGIVYILLGDLLAMPPNVAIPKAKSFLDKAISLDPECGEAHAHLVYMYLHLEWNFPAGKEHARRAVEVEPNAAITHWLNAHYLIVMGHEEEAIREVEIAIKLDPLTPLVYQNASFIYCFAGKYDKSLEYCERSLELDPEFVFAYLSMVNTYIAKGMFKKALSILEEKTTIPGIRSALLGYTYGKVGKRSEAKKILQDLEETWKKGAGNRVEFALVHLGLGEIDEALRYLEESVDEPPATSSRLSFLGMFTLSTLKVNAVWDPLRYEPRFKEILKKIGLEG
jgi:adenylate cyclase